MINYFVELTIIHLTLIVAYWIFLRRESQYGKMRLYLLGSTALAIIIPFLKLPKLIGNLWTSPAPDVPLETIFLEPSPVVPVNSAPEFDYSLLLYPYLVICLFLSYQFISSLLYLIRLDRNSELICYHEYYIRKTGKITGSFTFFNWIFVGNNVLKDTNEYEAILKHEQAHADLGHTYDLIFFQLFRIVCWWLPSSWFIHKEIKKIHEYQADARALKGYDLNEYSSILISSTLKSNGLSLASSFHDGLILKRIKAMKQNAKRVSPWKLGALLSLCAVLFVVFACNEELEQDIKAVGETSNLISFDQLPSDMQTSLADKKDNLSFIKAVVGDDQKISSIKELQELDPSLIEAINVDKENSTIYIAVRKDGANFDYLAEKSQMENEVFTIVEEQPEYPGGMKAFYTYVGENIEYPAQARSMGIEGRVYVQFIVEKDGSLSGITTVKGIGSGCDEEAERVLAGADKFIPGKQRGKAVKVRMVLPIIFKLSESSDFSITPGETIVIEEVQQVKSKLSINSNLDNGVWTGTVYDEETGKPLPGVSIIEQGTNSGTVSDLFGKFKLKASDNQHDLVLSFVGYQTTKLSASK